MDTAKLGLDRLAVGAVGQDEKADLVIPTPEHHGVDASGMQRVPGVPTSATILDMRPDGERPALHVRGASDHFDLAPDALDAALDAEVVHLAGTGLLAKLDGEPFRRLLEEAHRRGRTTTFDLIAATPETLAIVEPLLPHIDWFMPSIEEARDIPGRSSPDDRAAFFLDGGVGTCVLTLGGQGAHHASRDGAAFRSPPCRVDVVDMTGRGDAFDAGVIAGLRRGMDPETMMRFAQASAGLVATGLGSDAGPRSFGHMMECTERREIAM